jgi:hypothetical protein
MEVRGDGASQYGEPEKFITSFSSTSGGRVLQQLCDECCIQVATLCLSSCCTNLNWTTKISVFWDIKPVNSFENKPTFRRSMSPQSSSSKNKPNKKPA